jgi:hypothetical protein
MRTINVKQANLVILTIGVSCLFSTHAWAQLAILEYRFNEAGGATADSTGSDTAALTMRDTTGLAADYHGPNMSGVTNKPGDRSFYNRPLGMLNLTGYADQAFVPAIDGLVSFTLQAWVTPIPPIPQNNSQVLFFKFDGNRGFVLTLVGSKDDGVGAFFTVNGGAGLRPGLSVEGLQFHRRHI